MSKGLGVHDKGRSNVDFVCVFFLVTVVFLIALVGSNKYRIYKHSGEFDLLFDNTLKVYSYIADQNSENVAGIFDIFNLVPDGMTFKKDVFNDAFNTLITVKNRSVRRKDGGIQYDYYMFLNFHDPYLGILSVKPKICYNFLSILKKNSNQIEWIDIRQGASLLNFKLFGNDYCSGRNCLSSVTSKNINDMCYYCTSDTYCSMYVQLKTKVVQENSKKEEEKK